MRRLLPLLLLLGCPAGDDGADDDTDTDTDVVDTDDTDGIVDDTDDTDDTDADSDSDAPRVCADEDDAAIHVGTGDLEITRLVDGQTLEVVHGVQGSIHLPLALEMVGLPNPMKIRVRVLDATTEDPLIRVDPDERNVFLRGWSDATCDGDFPAFWGYTDVPNYAQVDRDTGAACPDPTGQPWEPYCGRRAKVVAEALDASTEAVLASTTLELVLQPDDRDGCHCEPDAP